LIQALGATKVDTAVERAKSDLKRNFNVVRKGASFTWSDVPVDPYEHLRKKAPEAALEYLLNTPRLKVDEKLALADAIRAGFKS